MKNILVLLIIMPFGLFAQNQNKTDINKIINNFSYSFSLATTSYGFNNSTQSGWSNIGIGELNVSYKINPKMSVGLGLVSGLGNCNAGFYNEEGSFVPFDDDDDDEGENEEHFDDDDDDDDQNGNNDDCQNDLDNIMATFNYKLSEKLPFFIQTSVGYAISKDAPAYSILLGYNQSLFSSLGLFAGVRYSDILYRKPKGAVSLSGTNGIKAELGVSWNF